MLIEEGIPIGNVENKYSTRNPILRFLMAGFLSDIQDVIQSRKKNINSIVEAGCGEGHLSAFIDRMHIAPISAFDFSSTIIKEAQRDYTQIPFFVRNIYDLNPEEQMLKSDLVICCEVFEHLSDPVRALKILVSMTQKYLLLSVPREPIWRVLNLMRGKYLRNLGNTPGHLNHWSKESFIRMVSDEIMVEEVKTPLPWTIIVCKKP